MAQNSVPLSSSTLLRQKGSQFRLIGLFLQSKMGILLSDQPLFLLSTLGETLQLISPACVGQVASAQAQVSEASSLSCCYK